MGREYYLLPQFPRVTTLIREKAILRLTAAMRTACPLFDAVPSYRNYEGDRFEIRRDDGTVSTSSYEMKSTTFSISIKNDEHLSVSALADKLERAGLDLARQASEGFEQLLNEVTAETGNVVDANGQPLTQEFFFKMLDKPDIDFDDAGRPQLCLMAHPDQLARMRAAFEVFHNDPQFMIRLDRILDRKREEFRDREARRKLVD